MKTRHKLIILWITLIFLCINIYIYEKSYQKCDSFKQGKIAFRIGVIDNISPKQARRMMWTGFGFVSFLLCTMAIMVMRSDKARLGRKEWMEYFFYDVLGPGQPQRINAQTMYNVRRY